MLRSQYIKPSSQSIFKRRVTTTTYYDDADGVILRQLKEVPYRQPTAEAWVLTKVNAKRQGFAPRDVDIY